MLAIFGFAGRRARRRAHHDRQARQDRAGRRDRRAARTRRHAAAVDALEAFFRRPTTMEFLPFGEAAIRKALPEDPDAAVVARPGRARRGRRRRPRRDRRRARFDPFLVRGMGYYTGPIFELAHPSVDYSLGGGGRYDGMIGRFLGTDVPATGSRSASSASSTSSTARARARRPSRSCTTPTCRPPRSPPCRSTSSPTVDACDWSGAQEPRPLLADSRHQGFTSYALGAGRRPPTWFPWSSRAPAQPRGPTRSDVNA